MGFPPRKRDWSSGCVGSRSPAQQYTQIKKSFFQLGSTPRSRSLSSSAEKPASTSAVVLRLSRVSSSIDDTQLHLCFINKYDNYSLWCLVLLNARDSIRHDLPTQNATRFVYVCAPTPAYNKTNIACLLAMDGSQTAPSGVLLTRAIGQVFNCNPPQFDGFLRYSKDDDDKGMTLWSGGTRVRAGAKVLLRRI